MAPIRKEDIGALVISQRQRLDDQPVRPQTLEHLVERSSLPAWPGLPSHHPSLTLNIAMRNDTSREVLMYPMFGLAAAPEIVKRGTKRDTLVAAVVAGSPVSPASSYPNGGARM
jgi:hypothetical protein